MGKRLPSREEFRTALEERHGKELQDRFSAASVAVCGLGGLGSNIAVALARAGVGKLHLIDFDRVDITNLNRQQYDAGQIGCFKTEAMADRLKAIAPYIEVRTDTAALCDDNIADLLKDDEVICEAFDSAEAKAMLVNNVLENMPDKYLVAGSGMAGLSSSNSIKTRRVTERFYLCGDGVSDVSRCSGLFAARVMVCAAHQANMILRIIAGEYDA